MTFNTKHCYFTLLSVLKQMKNTMVTDWVVKLHGFDMFNKRIDVMMMQEGDPNWTPAGLNFTAINNMFAILEEHAAPELFFEIDYVKPYGIKTVHINFETKKK